MADKKTSLKAVTKKAPAKTTKVTFADLKGLKVSELHNTLNTLREEIIVLQGGTRTGEVQNVHAAGNKKRELARVLTALSQKTAEEEK